MRGARARACACARLKIKNTRLKVMFLSNTHCTAGGRGQPKPAKLKRVAKLSKQEVCGCACGGHATAMVTRDGKLYMFGSLEDDLVDKTSGEKLLV